MSQSLPLRQMANCIRALSMDAVERAQSGHPGMPLGMADVLTVLYTQFMKFDPNIPQWPDRDRFILSAGHGSMALYSLLYLTGYEGATLEALQSFRKLGSPCAGHPEYGHLPGIETTTGPLGQGFANGVGMALGAAHLKRAHKTYVIAGDGCLMEGISQEALSFAGHQRLGNLIVLFDDNGITIDGSTALSTSDNALARFEASQWHVQAIDGHDYGAIQKAIEAAHLDPRPSLIACKTTIGYGAPTKAGKASSHGSPLGATEIQGVREALNWPHPPFHIPDDLLNLWRGLGHKGTTPKAEIPNSQWKGALQKLKAEFLESKPTLGTRLTSQKVIETITPYMGNLIGGSADLTGSNNTKAPIQNPLCSPNYEGTYIYYGIREHAMGAIMNGLALYDSLIPYGGTFLVFTDYMRPAIRLSALMEQQVIYVMTHDSIGLGEDGPTHQPIEHLASLRAIPNLRVFRPCDGIEVAECWELSLERTNGPSLLALSRQGLPLLREDASQNLSSKGGYLLRSPKGPRDYTIIATGSEVAIGFDIWQELTQEGYHVALVSMPSKDLFEAQSQEYRAEVLGETPRLIIEAGIVQGWEGYLAYKGDFMGMSGFGASAPAQDLYNHFNITKDKGLALARTRLQKGSHHA